MSTDAKTKTLLTVAKLSMRLGRRRLSRYSSIKSRHDFTQRQLMACLILRAYTKTTYRGIIELLAVSGELRAALGLSKLPHYSTLKKFADRAGVLEVIDAMLAEIAQAAAEVHDAAYQDAAMDSTGLETTSASAHYTARSGRERRRYVKLSVLVLCGSLYPAGLVVDWGPCNDKVEAAALMDKASRAVKPDTLLADAGYDAEWVHAHCHERWGVSSIIKPAQHRKDGKLNGVYRSAMTARQLKKHGYGRRWHVESFISALKRTTGSTLNARNEKSLFIEAAFRVLAYALRR
jgi:transposase